MEKHSQKSTEAYIREHRNGVQRKLIEIIKELWKRAEKHDESKLKEPEISGWRAMDKEPRYKYGTPEYFDKMERFKWVFEYHYKHNRHHPEYWNGFFQEMDLLDFLEMIIDWCSYKEDLTVTEMYKIVEENCKRFEFPPLLCDLAKNTLKNYVARQDDAWDSISAETGIPRPEPSKVDWSQWE